MSRYGWGDCYPEGADADPRAPWNEVETLCPECGGNRLDEIQHGPNGHCLCCGCDFDPNNDVCGYDPKEYDPTREEAGF